MSPFLRVTCANAAILVMEQNRGISYSRCASKRRKQGPDHVSNSSSMDLDINNCSQINDETPPEPIYHKKQKTTESQLPAEPTIPSLTVDSSAKRCSPKLGTPGKQHPYCSCSRFDSENKLIRLAG